MGTPTARARSCWVLVGVLAAAASLAGATAAAAGSTGDAEGTGVLLFCAVAEGLPQSPPLAELRAEGLQLMADYCAQQGWRRIGAAELEVLQRRLRVRSGIGFDPRLPRAAAEELGADRLIVLQLCLYPARLVAVARALATEDGRVTRAGAADVPVAPGAARGAPSPAAAWSAALREACGELTRHWREPARVPAESLLLLPVRTVGLDPMSSDLATACLLQHLLSAGRWRLPDPALAVGVLRENGRGFTALDPTACAALRAAFGPAPLVVPELISWAADSAEDGAPMLESGAEPVAALGPFTLAVRVVDTGDALVRRRVEAYLKVASPVGWFGAPRSVSPLGRLQEATERLLALSPFGPEES